MQTNNSKEKVRQLQNKLYLTAKKCDSRRFHALYDKVYRDDVLFEAWKRVKANKGSSGVDGVKIEDVEAMGIEKYLSEIKSELMNGKYKPSPVKRVMIPKPDGSERPLGIPTVKDRIVQMATKIAIEPVFEADFRECSYGFRPKRSAKQALEVVRKACNNKGYYVVDADIEKFFDNVNQGKLMKLVEQRISDRRILKLIKQWLVSGVLYGNVLTISELGTSQGSVISPLLANIYLNTLDRLWEKYGHTHGILVRYADDTVIICKNKKSAKSMHYNPFAYIRSEKDILKLVNTIIVNTKGEGQQASEDFWVKAEKLYYTALIAYIWYEAPEEEQNFSMLIDLVDASEAREDDENFKNAVDLLFEELEQKNPNHFAVRQYKKYKLAAGVVCSKRKDWNDVLRQQGDIPSRKFIAETITLRELPTAQPVPMLRMADVELTSVDWLWFPYIPFGKLTIIQGNPGEGKTYFAMRLAAACTNRKPLPGMETLEPFNIIYQTAEDGLGDTVKPRLMEADADLEKVLVIDDRDTPLTLADERIARAIRENNARLVIIDPVQAFLGADVDMNRANEVRPIFRSLGDIAQATGCAIVLIGHLNKAAGTQSTYRGLGSIDITAAVRSLLFIGKLKDSPTTRVLIHEKSSLAPPGQSLAFSLGDEKGFEWIGAYDITADELLAGTDTAKTESKTAQAQMLILELLADGKRMPSAELEKAVNERGISSRTMRTAKSRIGDRLVTEKDGTAWVCYLRD